MKDFPVDGGFGDPAERDRAAIEEDLAEGDLTRAAAETVYGYRGGTE
jgi:N-methylhydantoinase B